MAQDPALRLLLDLCQAETGGLITKGQPPVGVPLYYHLPEDASSSLSSQVSDGVRDAAALRAVLAAAGYCCVLVEEVSIEGVGPGYVYMAARNRDALAPSADRLLGLFGAHAILLTANAVLRRQTTRKDRQLDRLDRKLKATQDLTQRFLSRITHDLKTPLVPVLGLLRLVASGRVGDLNDQQAQYMAVCLRNLDKQVNIIEDLVDFKNAGRGRLELSQEPTDLCRMVSESLDSLEVTARVQGASFEADLGPEPLFIMADPLRLKRVLGNFMHGAMRLSREGDHIRLKIYGQERQALVELQGTGVTAEDLEPFLDAGATESRRDGSLALSVARSVIHLHGACISVQPQPEGGNSLVVAFKVAKETSLKEKKPGVPPVGPATDKRQILKRVPKLRKIKPGKPAGGRVARP
ncbi:MAG: HAMP domain-containing sensor histidine kinase [Pseudomonadota bacterium]